jgi:hypothetical protein
MQIQAKPKRTQMKDKINGNKCGLVYESLDFTVEIVGFAIIINHYSLNVREQRTLYIKKNP